MACTIWKDWMANLDKKLHSVQEVVRMLSHAAVCDDCGKAYDDWYYSPRNTNYDRYMKEDPKYRKEVEARKNGGTIPMAE